MYKKKKKQTRTEFAFFFFIRFHPINLNDIDPNPLKARFKSLIKKKILTINNAMCTGFISPQYNLLGKYSFRFIFFFFWSWFGSSVLLLVLWNTLIGTFVFFSPHYLSLTPFLSNNTNSLSLHTIHFFVTLGNVAGHV